MLTTLQPTGEELRILLAGELDHHAATDARTRIDDEIRRTQPRRLVLDFSGITFMDSSGIGLVMGRYKLVNAYGGVIEIVNTPRQLRRVMRLAGLDRLAEIDNGGQHNEAD